MTIRIPADTTLRPTDVDAPFAEMRVMDESTADIVAFDARTGVLTVKFEDGEEYEVKRADLSPSEIYENPGNHRIDREHRS